MVTKWELALVCPYSVAVGSVIDSDIDEPGIAPDFHDDALDRFVFMTGH